MTSMSLLVSSSLSCNVTQRVNLPAARSAAQKFGVRRASVVQQARRGATLVKPLAVAEIAAPQKGSSEEELTSVITMIHSPEELEDIQKANKDKLVVLECKATGCVPCKKFQPKFVAAAKHYTDAIFLEVVGNESPALRQLMKKLEVKVTPSFVMFRNGEVINKHGGAKEEKLHAAVQAVLKDTEAGYGSYTLLEPEA